jgi:hypothetical protein
VRARFKRNHAVLENVHLDESQGRFTAMPSSHHRHLSDRLIRTIEVNAEEFAEATVKKLHSSPRTEAYHKLSHRDLYNRCYEIYHNLGLWLWEKSDHAIQAQYNELGEKRFEEGIPLGQVLWAIITTKERLMDYLSASGLGDSAIDLYQQQEFVRLIDHFFDRALCYTGEGYERKAHSKSAVGENEEVRRARTTWLDTGSQRSAQSGS